MWKNRFSEIRTIKSIGKKFTRRGIVTGSLCTCVFSLLLFCSCGKKDQKISTTDTIPIGDYHENDISQNAASFADSLLTTLTLEERVGQCLMPSINSVSDSATLRILKRYIDDFHVGGVVLMKGNLLSARQLAQIAENSKIPLFVAIDAEWGLGMRLEDAPIYPKNGHISRNSGETALFDYGSQIAAECKEIGINMVLGPVIDINFSSGGVMGNRSFGDNPVLVSDFGVAYAKGLESGGVISVAKHFPGHGSAMIDSHKSVANLNKDIAALDTVELRPFRDYINSGLSGIMAGHIRSSALDPDGKAASVSMDMLTSLLREEMNFKGLILTDAFNMGGAKGFSAWEALNAGADIVLCPDDIDKDYKGILESLKSGALDLSIINERCRRVLFTKYLFSIYQHN